MGVMEAQRQRSVDAVRSSSSSAEQSGQRYYSSREKEHLGLYSSSSISSGNLGKDSREEFGGLGMERRAVAAENTVQRGGPLLERFRAIVRERERDREDDDLERPVRLREDEVIALYKNALSELTFNSKPVITDLTIIAGEQSHAAKGIAATVCNHILEVPIEQKLPSLYLLDSIVKNIGGDYVRYFAARLPEVFCSSYRQVDPSSYHAMQHLFGTWGGVFHATPLRIIEAELQFTPAANGPSSGTTSSRPPESQAQRPGHSIHVNPKYLEARQQFEQSSMAEGSNSENNDDSSSPEPERSGRSVHESPKAWSEAPRRLHNARRPERGDAFLDPGYGQKPASRYLDYDFNLDETVSSSRVGVGRPSSPFPLIGSGRPSSPLTRLRGGRAPSPPRLGIATDSSPSKFGSRNVPSPSRSRIGIGRIPSPSTVGIGRIPSPSTVGIGRLNDKIVEQDNGWERPWHGKGDGDAPRPLDTTHTGAKYGQRNGYDWRQHPMQDALIDAYGNYRGQRSLRGPLSQLQPPQEINVRNARVMSRNWQNSEEEEYMWEDMSPRLGNHARGSENARKDDSLIGDINKWPGLGRGKRMGPEPVLSDSDWRVHGSISHMDQPMISGKDRLPLRRESEEHHPSSHSLPGIASRARDTNIETSSLLKSNQGPFGHRPGLVRPPLTHQNSAPSQSRLRTLQASVPGRSSSSTGVPSFNLAHSGGHLGVPVHDIRSMGTELTQGMLPKSHTNAGSSLGIDPLSFELSSATPAPNNMPFSRRQQSERHASPSHVPQFLGPVQSIHPMPPSGPPPQQPQFQPTQQHRNNFMKPGQLHVQGHPMHSQGLPSQPIHQSPNRSQPVEQVSQQHPLSQKMLQSQAAPDLLNQLPYSLPQVSHMLQQLPTLPEVQQIPPVTYSQMTQSQPLMQSQPLTQVQLNYGAPQNLGSVVSTSMGNPNSGFNSGQPLIPPVPNNFSSSVPGRVQPPLPPGPPPASSLVASTSQVSSSLPSTSMSSVSSILSSLMAKGVISVTAAASNVSLPPIPTPSAVASNQPPENNVSATALSITTSLLSIPSITATLPTSVLAEAQTVQDLIGTQFSPEILRVRHESVLSALYDDLPRQCTSCGLRFKHQEEHSNHMDWHVSKNRTIAKSRKQKPLQSTSRKWFLSAKEWLNGTENSAVEVVPAFSPVETTLDKNDNEEVAVPVDDAQSVCILCGELFEFFYSDERDEWMFKGAVYTNAPDGSTEGMDASQLGPIVHAKCRSKSTGASLGDSEEDEMEGNDDCENRRKRARC